MSRYLRFGLIGCGGLLALFVLFAACAALIGGNQGTDTKSEDEASPSPAPSPSPEPSPSPPPAQEKKNASTETVVIRVTGTPGIGFSGSFGASGDIRSVDGVTPQDFEEEMETGFLKMDVISATMQKQAQDNSELRVEMVVDGETVKEQSTTSPFGVVSLTLSSTDMQ